MHLRFDVRSRFQTAPGCLVVENDAAMPTARAGDPDRHVGDAFAADQAMTFRLLKGFLKRRHHPLPRCFHGGQPTKLGLAKRLSSEFKNTPVAPESVATRRRAFP